MSEKPTVEVAESTSRALVPVEVQTASPSFVPLSERFGPRSDLVECFEGSYLVLKLRGAAATTIDRYYKEFRRLSRFLGRDPIVGDMRDETLSRLMADMTDKGSAPPTVNKTQSMFVAFSRLLQAKGVLKESIEIPALTEPRRAPVAWTVDEVRRLIAAAGRQEGYLKNGIPAAGWWKSFLMAAYDSGERRGALEQATWSDLDVEKLTLTLPAEVRKGSFADFVHRLKPETIKEIEGIRHPSRKRIWAWPLSSTSLYTTFDELVFEAGLPRDTRNKFHKIRRSTATHVKLAGGNATEAMGHSSEQLTKRHYLDPTQLPTQSPADLLPSIVTTATETDLSDVEIRIVEAMLAGMSDDEIFQWSCTYPSHHTLDLECLYKKLGTKDRDKIIQWGRDAGIRPMDEETASRGNNRGGTHESPARRSAWPHTLPPLPKRNEPPERRSSEVSLTVLPEMEKRVAAALVCGKGIDDISRLLGVDIISVANLLTSLQSLLGLDTQIEIAHWAESVGLGPADCEPGGDEGVYSWM